MKCFHLSALILLCTCLPAFTQNVTLRSLDNAPFSWTGNITMQAAAGGRFVGRESKVTATGQIRFVDADVELVNVELDCPVIVFARTVNQVFIGGNVKFLNCKNIIFENTPAAPGPIQIDKLNTNPAELIMDYSGVLNFNSRPAVIATSREFTVTSTRKN